MKITIIFANNAFFFSFFLFLSCPPILKEVSRKRRQVDPQMRLSHATGLMLPGITESKQFEHFRYFER